MKTAVLFLYYFAVAFVRTVLLGHDSEQQLEQETNPLVYKR